MAAGRNVTFTATVRAVAPGSGTPSGTVTFIDGSTTIGTVAVGGTGTAALTTNALGRGTHTLTARYNGSASYLASTSPAVTQRITWRTPLQARRYPPVVRPSCVWRFLSNSPMTDGNS